MAASYASRTDLLLFLGLILGVLPFLFRQARAKSTFKAQQYVLLVIGAILIASLAFLNESEGAVIENMTLQHIFCYLFPDSSAVLL